MAESMSGKSFREVVVPSSPSSKWKEITVNTGASASTLQDLKVPDSCGGFSYQDSGLPQSAVRNRFIYWRTSNDVLELVEQSLDFNLLGSQVRFKFQDTQIFGGVTVWESHGNVIILVSTVASVHRLIFPHPSRLQRMDIGCSSDQVVQSIFFDASLMTAADSKNMHMLNPGGSVTSHLHSAATFLNSDGDALFSFSSNTGNILLIKMPPPQVQGVVQQFDLRQSSMMQKLFSGLIRSGQEATDSATSMVIQMFRGDVYIFAVCRDHKLRIWSTKTRECILAYNLLECCPDLQHVQPVTGSGHTIKKVLSGDAIDLKLCVYLNFPDRNQFCFVQIHMVNGRLEVFHNATVFGTPEDLVDYSVTEEHLWTLWTNQTGESVARVRNMTGQLRGDNWSEVILQPQENSDILVPRHADPREVYLARIFHPRRFNVQDIKKALNVYRRSMDMTVTGEMTLQVNTLKEEVTLAVEDAIRNSAASNELAEEEYYQIQLDQWTKFHSCCVQYQEVGAKMKGLLTDPITGLVCLIKKGCVTYIRPCDRIEELCYGSGEWTDQQELDHAQKFDVEMLGRCLELIRSKVTDEAGAQFDYCPTSQEEIRTLANHIVEELFTEEGLLKGSTSMMSLGDQIQRIINLPDCIQILLDSMDLTTQDDVEDTSMDDGESTNHQLACSRLFTSGTAVEILSATLQQVSVTRLSALRDLLILQEAACQLGDRDGITPDVTGRLHHDLIPHTLTLLQSYMLLKWVSESVATPSQTSTLEFNVRQLASLEINDGSGLTSQQRASLQNIGLAELFIQAVGGTQARQMLAQTRLMENEPCATWTLGILGLTKFVSRLVWPMSPYFVFPEFLVGSCQYLQLQEYVRLLSSWCEWHVASRRFMLGLCYLHFDEPQKAGQCFTAAKEGVATETFLRQKLLQTDETHNKRLEVLYYLKVIKQFEEFGAPDMVVSLAKTGISIAEDDDPNVPTLWSKLFKYQLELGHNMEAYSAMIANPDPSRRKDCLRQLLVTLCERGDLQALISFPYIDLEEEVVNILESRARSVDLLTHNYYDLLYAFHIFRNNFRKAGRVMYEHGTRLGREVPGKRGLERQAQCYLATMNVLRLVKPEYAWIVKPVQKLNRSKLDDSGSSPKHFLDGEEKLAASDQKMEIMELSDIEKEFMLVDARLRLIQKDTDPALSSGPTPGPDEMVGLLVKAGMYDRAITVCQVFDMKLVTVFESLALRCVKLSRSSSWDNSVVTVTWDWLQENNLALSNLTKDTSATDLAWLLLQHYLETYEDHTGQYHRCIAMKLLSQAFPLPTWLINSYKGLNTSELLRVYIDYDMLEDAVILTMEYIDAVMDSFTGHGSELFNLRGCLQNHTQTAWLPYTCIDQLLIALQDHKHDITHGKLYESLQNKMDTYYNKLSEQDYNS
ncbi:nuclear pore complex protein Nup160-like [Ylistrum balloti]|uniref:nuclear pore complex protein Nup160-like n=1 Tax=Ylistrum balloti TaxID=509963 RepID=UPI002905AEF9|nr:nuclear pore complex protein Nup160-like [Ylistrum balloti]